VGGGVGLVGGAGVLLTGRRASLPLTYAEIGHVLRVRPVFHNGGMLPGDRCREVMLRHAPRERSRNDRLPWTPSTAIQ
jgi:hypothetical protein